MTLKFARTMRAAAGAVALLAFGASVFPGAAVGAEPGKPAASAPMSTHSHGGMAHDMSIGLSIPDGAVLRSRPTTIQLDFNPAMRLRSAVLTNAAGERIPLTFDAKAAAPRVTVTFAALEPDAYTFAFNADAGDHDMPGRIRFVVR